MRDLLFLKGEKSSSDHMVHGQEHNKKGSSDYMVHGKGHKHFYICKFIGWITKDGKGKYFDYLVKNDYCGSYREIF